jgi:cytochrome c-type biogenesis protein CcmE
MLESEESFVDAEENELRTSAFRSRKWKALAGFMVLCAFLVLLLYYIGDNVQWFRKAAKIEKPEPCLSRKSLRASFMS